ncbi:unnamed protein product [Protopolystoma xenopodis]|uniref:Uncharacterized protein n=1 Tax=Protopolystoma xenopodis TaxID=117903 RepID=A0A3S5FBW1_9PLAT|nr:unnamed protein product [Protopolystoma xenopodis]
MGIEFIGPYKQLPLVTEPTLHSSANGAVKLSQLRPFHNRSTGSVTPLGHFTNRLGKRLPNTLSAWSDEPAYSSSASISVADSWPSESLPTGGYCHPNRLVSKDGLLPVVLEAGPETEMSSTTVTRLATREEGHSPSGSSQIWTDAEIVARGAGFKLNYADSGHQRNKKASAAPESRGDGILETDTQDIHLLLLVMSLCHTVRVERFFPDDLMLEPSTEGEEEGSVRIQLSPAHTTVMEAAAGTEEASVNANSLPRHSVQETPNKSQSSELKRRRPVSAVSGLSISRYGDSIGSKAGSFTTVGCATCTGIGDAGSTATATATATGVSPNSQHPSGKKPPRRGNSALRRASAAKSAAAAARRLGPGGRGGGYRSDGSEYNYQVGGGWYVMNTSVTSCTLGTIVVSMT